MTFIGWVGAEFALTPEQLEDLHLRAAFDIFVCRCEAARRHGARDPLSAASPKRAGGNSRQVTRGMLGRLGYTRTQLRVIHRLMAGSPAGWPGLLSLYADHLTPTTAQRHYVRKQIQLCSEPPATRTGSNAGWVSRASTP